MGGGREAERTSDGGKKDSTGDRAFRHPDQHKQLGIYVPGKQGRWAEAEKLHAQAMETRKAVLGPKHPDTLTRMANLASTYHGQGRLMEAENLHTQVMEARKTILGPEHPDTLASVNNLALTYREQGRWTEAEKLLMQEIEIAKTVQGPEHPDTLTNMNNLAFIYGDHGRWAEAEKLNVQVLETRKTILGPEHPETLISMWGLSYVWKQQGRDSDALAMLEACVQLQNQKLGPNHPDTVSAVATLKEWQTSLTRHSSSRSSPGSPSGRQEIHQLTELRAPHTTSHTISPAPEIHHPSNQRVISTKRPPSSDDQLQRPRKRDVIMKLLFRRK
jgi:Tetratricopeptide repeat